MASEADVARLRRMTDLAEDDAVYTDSVLGGMIDDLGFESAAASVWREKAAGYAGLVDTSESGSTRRLSQLHAQALAMGAALGPVEAGPAAGGGSFTVEIERV